jgi:hypothetical protein
MIPDYLNDTDPFYQHLLGPPDNLNVSTDEIGSLIVSGTLLVCSDGYYKPEEGTGCHGWVMASSSNNLVLQGAGPNDGNPASLSPYRSELSGLLVILY